MNTVVENITEKPHDYSVTLDTPGEFFYVVYGFGSFEKKIEVRVAAEGVEAHILGLFIGNSGSCKIETVQHHSAPHSMSNLHIKSILDNDASFSYRGIIEIEKQAQQSNAYQQNDNLLMSPDAHVTTKPELEIIANDVKCSHGATIGQLDDEMLYYMQTRGVEKKEARQLALYGFAQDIVHHVPDTEAQTVLKSYIDKALIAQL